VKDLLKHLKKEDKTKKILKLHKQRRLFVPSEPTLSENPSSIAWQTSTANGGGIGGGF